MVFERERGYDSKMLYDKKNNFNNYEEASRFALMNMPAVLVRQYPLQAKKEELKDLKKPYIVAAEFLGKYNHECYDGSSDALVNFDAIRCSENYLEQIIECFVSERNFKKMYVGLELKVFGNFAKDYVAKIE
jgi:hypothetical protein